jgi:hypothetical protein
MPNGCVVNEFVPFYFSPITSFTFTIYKGNVPRVSPEGQNLGQACEDDRIFFVARPEAFSRSGLFTCFSDFALNSNAPLPTIKTGLNHLKTHVHWEVFDEGQRKADIPEIGYQGVCKYFHNLPSHMTRSSKRMAEFLVHGAVPLDLIECIVAKTDTMRDDLKIIMDASAWSIPIYTNRGCYYG